MTSPQGKGLPVELTRYEFERLYSFVHDTTTRVNSLGAKQLQQTNRLHERLRDKVSTVSPCGGHER